MSLRLNYGDDLDRTFSEGKDFELSTREHVIFLIEGTPEMYESDSLFLQCLETYRNIVRSKCSRNRMDKLGVMIFGTQDSNCEVEHLTVFQEFDTVTVDTLKKVQTTIKDGAAAYKKMASNSKYSMYDILKYAYQSLLASGTNLKTSNTIVLCTTKDNPCVDDAPQRRLIQYYVETFKDTRTKLQVIGLSNSWDDEYYKDLQFIAGTFIDDYDYRRIKLIDFQHIILNPSKSIWKLPWKITPEITIEVSIYNLVSRPTYPAKVKLEKGKNTILASRPVYKTINPENNFSEIDPSNFDEKTGEFGHREETTVGDNIMYYKCYGDKRAYFTKEEVRKIKTLGLEPGIQILSFKRVVLNPLYHVESGYFVSDTSLSSNESKSFFRAFVSKCHDKKVMAICRVVTKMSMKICTMIPSVTDGGFYMRTTPFKDAVREFDKKYPHFVFNSDNPCKISKKGVKLFEELINISQVTFDIRKFSNPRLEKCIAHIEALALDEKLGPLPPDSTLPPPVPAEAKPYVDKLIQMFDLRTAKEAKKRPGSKSNVARKKAKFDVVEMASKKALPSLTVADLREYLKSVNQSTVGNKSVLVDRIYNYLRL